MSMTSSTHGRKRPEASGAHRMMARRRFGGYKKESEKSVRQESVAEDKTTEQLSQIWKGCGFMEMYLRERESQFGQTMYGMDFRIEKSYRTTYPMLLNTVRARLWEQKFEPSPEDVQRFSIALGRFSGEELFSVKAGMFLTALMECSSHKDFTLNIASPMDLLGISTRKNITINGNAGSHLGALSHGATITVHGDSGECTGIGMRGSEISVDNAGDCAGSFMASGTLRIRGDASAGLGEGLSGGKVLVSGNAAGAVGYGMTEGEIEIDGDVGSARTSCMPSAANIGPLRGGIVTVRGDIQGDLKETKGGLILVYGEVKGTVSPDAKNVCHLGALVGSGVIARKIHEV